MEAIIIHGHAGGVDQDGYPIPGEEDREVMVKSVQPINLQDMQADDRNGVFDRLRVWAPAGTIVRDKDEVTIRGLRYQVHISAWDWNKHRKPWNSRHQPSVVFDCVRGAG